MKQRKNAKPKTELSDVWPFPTEEDIKRLKENPPTFLDFLGPENFSNFRDLKNTLSLL